MNGKHAGQRFSCTDGRPRGGLKRWETSSLSINETIDRHTESITERLIDIRRTIHANPELAFEEVETAKLIADALEAEGISHRTGVGKTGVVAMIEGEKPGRTVAVRGDMDALPVHEETGLPFASRHDGKMHACGHDVHSSILLGVASVLNSMRDEIPGRVKLLFQPAEEILGGAQAMIDDGVLDDPPVDVMLGYHNWPPLEAGKIGWFPGMAMASADAFDITITGRSGHGAHPHKAIDVISAASYFVTQAQTIISREIAPMGTAVVSVGEFHAGTARNILPDTAVLRGTVRTLSPEARKHIEAALRRLLDGLKTGMRIDYTFDYIRQVPALHNDPDILKVIIPAITDLLGADNLVRLPEASMGAEDFALFSELRPSGHLRIGSQTPGRNDMLHNSDFQPDERAIPTGVRAVTRATLALLA